MTHKIAAVCVVVSGLLISRIACATAITMNFDTLSDEQYAAYYYDGGCTQARFGGPVNCGGPDYGIVLGGLDTTTASAGLASNLPSSPNVAYVPFSGGLGITSSATGFSGVLSFQYSEPGVSRSISIYSGNNGTGTLLGTFSLPSTGGGCGAYYGCWDAFSASFSGTARSAMLSNWVPPNGQFDDDFAIDNISLNLGSVPGPSALGIFGFGLLLIGSFVGLRRHSGLKPYGAT